MATLATLAGTVPGEGLTAALAERLVEPRHARIAVYDGASGRTLAPGTAAPRPDPAPAWFARLVAPHAEPLTFLLARYALSAASFALIAVWVGAAWPNTARAWRDARVTRIWAGSNEIMKELIGRDLGL